MADYSAMKSYLGKYYLHYSTFSLNSVKSMAAVIRHLAPDTPPEDISSGLDDFGFNVISVGPVTATQTARGGQTHVESFHPFLVILTFWRLNVF
jgi:hypothetical protein